ncbi:hypothetical protein MF573_00325 [Klebsiella pneumoniae]|nr:hypothetical protein MF573_00325 [Klebsiella pneumoniae]
MRKPKWVGKHGMWEMPGVPVEAFSGRSVRLSGRPSVKTPFAEIPGCGGTGYA